MRKPRKNYTPPQKVAILRRHLIDQVPVSDLCDEYQLSPTLFYAWQKIFFENGATAFERKNATPGAEYIRVIEAAPLARVLKFWCVQIPLLKLAEKILSNSNVFRRNSGSIDWKVEFESAAS